MQQNSPSAESNICRVVGNSIRFLPNSIEKLPIPSEPVQIPTQTQSVPSSSRRAMKDDNRLGRTNQFNDPIDFADQMGGGFWALRGGAPRRRPLRHQIPGLRLEQSVPHDGTARAGLRTVRPGQRLRRPPTSLAQFGHIQIPPVVSVPKVIQFNNDYFILHVDRDSFIPTYHRGGGMVNWGSFDSAMSLRIDLGWLPGPDVFRSHSASSARQVIWLIVYWIN